MCGAAGASNDVHSPQTSHRTFLSQPIRPDSHVDPYCDDADAYPSLPNNSSPPHLPRQNAAADHSYPSDSNPSNKQGLIRFGALAAVLIVVLLTVLPTYLV
ncbi:hypothetical protein B0H14DRAFT_3469415 [Mycena olivaceomarginata]|nr:hypothetical protein B0H14DRAFT_3469415 [Mycena olivaceomarginata]